MSIAVQCPQCGVRLGAPESLAGKKARCKCGAVLNVPAPGAQAAAATAAQSATALRATSAAAPRAAAAVVEAVGACPACGAALLKGAVLCTMCGLDLRSGKRLSVNVDAPTDATASKARTVKPPKPPSAAAAAVGRAVKRIVIVAIVVGIVGGLGWTIYEWVRFDPAKQAQQKMAKIGAGMTVAQVVAVMGRPQQVYVYLDGEQREKLHTSAFEAKVGYDDDFMKTQGPEKLRNGFRFDYIISTAGLSIIEFDGNGTVQGKGEAPNIFRR